VTKRWYIIHAMSGHENKVVKLIEESATRKNLTGLIEKIVIPVANVVEIKRGKKVTVEKKFLPGYILIKMDMSDDLWHIIKSTPKVTGFLGGNIPQPVSDAEVDRIFKQMEEGPSIAAGNLKFDTGDSVKVVDGPFESFIGVVMDVDEEKERLKVSVSIFGRPTPVELEFTQVEKI